jgi:hypothetical protein
MKAAEQQTAGVKEELKAAAPTLQKVRSLDQKLADQKKAVSEGDEGCKKDAAKIDADKKARLQEQEKRSKAHETLDLVDGYLKEHAKDEWLIGGLAGDTEQSVGPPPVNGRSVTGTVICGLGNSTPRMPRMVGAANWRCTQERQFVLAR